jgi:hypothetical protein
VSLDLRITTSARSPQEKKGCHESGREEGKGTLIKIITFQKKSNVGNDTLFTLCLLPKDLFV